MRGDDAAVEQAGASQQEGAGADAASAARAGVAPAQPGARLAMGAGALHAGAAGHHDHVHRTIPVFREGAVHLHAQALVPGGDHGFGGHGAQLVQRGLGFLVGGAERLPGAGQIQRLEAVVQHEDDAFWRNRRDDWHARAGCSA